MNELTEEWPSLNAQIFCYHYSLLLTLVRTQSGLCHSLLQFIITAEREWLVKVTSELPCLTGDLGLGFPVSTLTLPTNNFSLSHTSTSSWKGAGILIWDGSSLWRIPTQEITATECMGLLWGVGGGGIGYLAGYSLLSIPVNTLLNLTEVISDSIVFPPSGGLRWFQLPCRHHSHWSCFGLCLPWQH